MNHVNYFKDLFESIPDYRKILMFSIKNDADLLNECGFLKSDFNSLCLEYKFVIMEQSEEYLDYIKDQEESVFEGILNK